MYRQKKKITFLLFKFDWIKKKCYINMVCMANLMNQLNSILKKVEKILEPLLFFYFHSYFIRSMNSHADQYDICVQ